MTPCETDTIGIVHYSNPNLHIPEREYPTTTQFFPDDTRIRVKVNHGMEQEGWLVGILHNPLEGEPDYFMVANDKGQLFGIHESWIDKTI